MPPYDLAMLDFDGTLVDSASSIVYCVQRTFRSMGEEPPSETAIRATIGLPLSEALVHLQCRGRPTDSEAWVRAYRETFTSVGTGRLQLFEGAAQFLAGLADKGIPAVIVTARKTEITNALLQNFGLSGTILEVYGDTPQGPNKPDPRLYEELIRPRFNHAHPSNIIMVGDTHIDLEFARNTGAVSCWASYGYGDAQKCRNMQPDFEVSHPTDLLRLF
ncbi:MAG: HAD family hydrolase [Deltaproteobacteria bacterium]|nr:HAD family hydrolase [Deltaproteobacteria bacterium]